MENLPYCLSGLYCSHEGSSKQYRFTCDLTQLGRFGCKIKSLAGSSNQVDLQQPRCPLNRSPRSWQSSNQDAFRTSPNLRPKVEGLHLRIFFKGRESPILEGFGDCMGMYCYNWDDMKVNYETNTGFHGDNILYKNLQIFDKIFVPTFCRRRFRNAFYGEKILSMGKCYVWAWFRQKTCLGSSMRGNLNCLRLEITTYFFFDTWVRFAREGKAVALQYHEQ